VTERHRVPVSKKGERAQPELPELAETCDCPRLERDEWHEVESDWSDITFVQTSTTAVLGVPVGYESTRSDLQKKAAKLGVSVPDDAMLLMGEGRFRRPVMLEVEGAETGARGVVTPGGIAYSRLVPAPWGQIQRLVDETVDLAKERYGGPPDDLWLWYLTCRVCSKEREFETLIIAHYAQRRPDKG
jgi:hypothetical protein